MSQHCAVLVVLTYVAGSSTYIYIYRVAERERESPQYSTCSPACMLQIPLLYVKQSKVRGRQKQQELLAPCIPVVFYISAFASLCKRQPTIILLTNHAGRLSYSTNSRRISPKPHQGG
jgi:hypothetical protein